MQKSGAGLHTANSCYWDTTTDGKAFSSLESLSALIVLAHPAQKDIAINGPFSQAYDAFAQLST